MPGDENAGCKEGFEPDTGKHSAALIVGGCQVRVQGARLGVRDWRGFVLPEMNMPGFCPETLCKTPPESRIYWVYLCICECDLWRCAEP